MKIELVMFAAAREGTGCGRLELETRQGWTIADLKQELKSRWPGLAELITRSAFAVNHNYATDNYQLQEDDEVGWIPPVSGG